MPVVSKVGVLWTVIGILVAQFARIKTAAINNVTIYYLDLEV
jgi:hypothetical protein